MFSKSNLFGRDASGQRSTLNPPTGQPASGAMEGNTGRTTPVSGRATSDSYNYKSDKLDKSMTKIAFANTASGDTAVADTAQNAVLSDDEAIGARLIVGPEVKLCGAEILNCDMLVVEGRVEATMDSRVLRIAEHGSFVGKVSIDVAEIYGDFEGELTARSQLVIHATGRVRGKVCYGKLVAEEGCELCGDINILAGKTSGPSAAGSGSASPLSRASGSTSAASSSGNAASGKDKAGKGVSSALNVV